MQEWYVRRDGAVADGPHDIEQLRVLWGQGALDSEAEIRAGMDGDWLPLSRALPEMTAPRTTGTNWASLRFRGGATEPGMPDLAVEDDGWQQARPAPWRRFFGRTFDTMLFLSVGSGVLASLMVAYFPQAYEAVFAERKGMVLGGVLSSLMLYAWIIVCGATLLGLTGTTPGKWLFGTRVTYRDGRPIGLWPALRREFSVLLVGQGLGLPLITLVANGFAYATLRSDGVSTWDAMDRWVVTHRPWGAMQAALVAATIVVPMMLVVAWNMLGDVLA
ncbi:MULTISPECIES: RDD family protein [Stenotrophomonas]|jgi:uncharacterized RDD family membrane protein YckC|uniref:RDD family protein n=1 Tax=Stenotrophomonas TaxID=40323 RepID=UPI000A8D7C21|nr:MULTISPECIES: RDD family protein [Stenotrophomonas]QOF98449.1 RDD family protein [Stenotrophomonas sp. CW117]